MTQPLFIFGIGPIEAGIIVALVLLLFGYKAIPAIAKRAGEVTGRARRADEDFKAGKEESQ